ncbi:8277_t:CDS:10 [Paraglomus occultum]|uniref:8277_t:CDS:1 n=1 Tax=Paraglomus occultum TaxID=144539 RepID=A0A9N8ZBX9_9GLOM|nr:8277_t:CDS:10 [Paraglomus occultum]
MGAVKIPTGINLKFPPNTTAMLLPADPSVTWIVNMLVIKPEQWVEVSVIAPFQSQTIAAGQKIEEKPSPFLKKLMPDQDQALNELLSQYEDIFATDLKQLDFIEAEVSRMLEANIIKQLDIDTNEDSRAMPFAAPVVVVGKKDGSNNEVFSNIAKRGTNPKYFSVLDLASGYWQNALASFQSMYMMDLIFRDQIDKHMAVFIDDISIYSHSFEEHLEHIKQTFDKCRKYGLKLKMKKCHFGCEKLEFLGHVVSREGLMVDPRKIDVIKNYGTLINSKQICTFLGMTGYYARFVLHYQHKAAPLLELIRKRSKFVWNPMTKQCDEGAKGSLSLRSGAVLSQWDPDQKQEFAVAFTSRQMTSAEKNYNATNQEGLAVIWAIGKFFRYLHGRHFNLYTDHAALTSIIKTKEPKGRMARWSMELQQSLINHKPTMDLTAYEELKVKALTDRGIKITRGALFIEKGPTNWRRVIQHPNHEEIIWSIHESAHLSVQNTVNKIKERYCIVGLDHVGPLHKMKDSYLYIIVAQDYFTNTKWPIAKPTKTTNTDEALKFVYEDIYTVYGKPQQLITDQGTAFTSNLWKRTMQKWKIKHTPTTAANPQANSQVKRFNQTLVKMLKKKLGARKDQWDQKLQGLLMDYRASVQATTEKTPAEKKQEKVKNLWEANKGLATPFEIGDLMLLYAPVHKKKLEQAWEGPFKIRQVGKRGAYQLETLGGAIDKWVTRRRLIKYNDRNQAQVELGETSQTLE